ncbi:MAG TPA: cobyrinate a,c-diamide synthase [Acidobacteriaceae bacterium]
MRAIPRIVIGGVSSGAGKTTFTVGLCRALQRRGLRVAAFKAGPDYLDPTYHARATGGRSHNLDAWMMGRQAVLATFASAAQDADVAIVEGVMGLFDGADPTSEEGSTAQIAKWLGAPVLLALDASGMARTVAAIAHGFSTFDPDVELCGLLANRVGSRSHLSLLEKSVMSPPLLGGLPKDPALRFPERHLGLVTADECTLTDQTLETLANTIEAWCRVDRILEIAQAAEPLDMEGGREDVSVQGEVRCRIAYALDEAFHFYYDDNLRRLRSLGAELVPFSPIRDETLSVGIGGIYLGGGYPEVHAEALAANSSMRRAMVDFAEAGGPIYAECGGLMYLTGGIRKLDGSFHAMTGLISGEVVMHDRLQSLGYVEVETQSPSILGDAGLTFRGHQFRYSELRGADESAMGVYAMKRKRNGVVEREGYRRGANVVASYVHAHWASNPDIAANFVAACARFAQQRSAGLLELLG